MLYTFGKIVEEEEGSLAVWTTYIMCALGENLSAPSFFLQGAASLAHYAA